MKITPAILLHLFFVSVCCPSVFGLAEERIGPVPDAHPQPDWAAGLIVPLRHPSRVYSRWVNGNENIFISMPPRIS